MKRFAVCFLLVMFLLAGCAMGLTSLNPTLDLQKNISTLMKEVKKCEPDGAGWRILEIPDRAYMENQIKFIVYKHSMRESWGVGIVNGQEIYTVGYDSQQDLWIYGMPFGVIPITQEQAEKFIQEWVELICKEGDFSKAKKFNLSPKPPTGVEVL